MLRGRSGDSRDPVPAPRGYVAAPNEAPRIPFSSSMHRLPILLIPLLLFASDVGAQVLDDALVPRGLARVEVSPVYTSWDSRFGRLPDGSNRREHLGDDLTSTTAQSIFP